MRLIHNHYEEYFIFLNKDGLGPAYYTGERGMINKILRGCKKINKQ